MRSSGPQPPATTTPLLHFASRFAPWAVPGTPAPAAPVIPQPADAFPTGTCFEQGLGIRREDLVAYALNPANLSKLRAILLPEIMELVINSRRHPELVPVAMRDGVADAYRDYSASLASASSSTSSQTAGEHEGRFRSKCAQMYEPYIKHYYQKNGQANTSGVCYREGEREGVGSREHTGSWMDIAALYLNSKIVIRSQHTPVIIESLDEPAFNGRAIHLNHANGHYTLAGPQNLRLR